MAAPNPPEGQPAQATEAYVGTLVGESTSTEFRLAVAQGTVREQDLIAVDAELDRPDGGAPESIRVWAKVTRIERINPLFPTESGHELAATKTNPFDTVLSLSREMVSAICQVLGSEPRDEAAAGKLNQLRYPAKPATSAYRPESADITRIVVGKLQDPKNANRAVDFAHLANRDDVHVSVDGHAIVVRHLAILAMTGSGKTWAARRIIEQLALKNYPIVIFDPRGDYTGLGDVDELRGRVTRYYADFPLFEEDTDTIMRIVNALAYPLTDTMETRFSDLCDAAKGFYIPDDKTEMDQRVAWLANRIQRDELRRFGVLPNMWLIAHLAEAGEASVRDATEKNAAEKNPADAQQLQDWGWRGLSGYPRTDLRTMEGIKKRTYKAASVLQRMERTNRKIASTSALPLPTDKTELVKHGQISVIALAGYTGEFQATIYNLIAEKIFEARVSDDLKLPVLLVLEEAHNFAPGKATNPAEERAVTVTRQIAQEGRKFQVGLLMISQRPNRLDETALSMCNSYVIMKMINPADQNFVRRVVESLGEDDVRMLTNLDTGEAILTGEFISFPVLVKVKPPASRGEREEEDAFVALGKMKAAADEADAKTAKSKKR